MLAIKAKQIITEIAPVLAEKYGHVPKMPTIEISNRLTRALGYATSRNVMKLSGVHFTGHHESEAFRGTVIHETCHLYEYQLKKQLSHGAFWKELMVACGQKPDRLFGIEQQQQIAYQRIQRNVQLFPHSCECQTYNVKKSIHEKIIFGAKYTCKLCKTAVK